MTYTEACNLASKTAKETNETRYVVGESWEYASGVEYYSANDHEVDGFFSCRPITHFFGCHLYLTFGPDGNPV